MELSFLVGLVLAIPLAVVANLITPRVQGWIDKRSRRAMQKKSFRLQEEYLRIAQLRSTREGLSEHLLTVLLRVALVGALFGVVTSAVYALGYLFQMQYAFVAAAQVFAILGSLIVLGICTTAFKEHAKVKNFVEYRDFVEKELGEEFLEQAP